MEVLQIGSPGSMSTSRAWWRVCDHLARAGRVGPRPASSRRSSTVSNGCGSGWSTRGHRVAMEATGIYWKPVWFVLEDVGFELLLVNAAQHADGAGPQDRRRRCRLDRAAAGVRAAARQPRAATVIRELRELTRYRKRLVQDRTREGQRVEKVLEDAGIKLASVASQTLSVSGRAMIDALIAGERDPEVLADLAKKKMRVKIPQLRRALVGRFGEHHAAMVRLHLDHIDHLDALIDRLDDQIETKLVPFAEDCAGCRRSPGSARPRRRC